MEQAMYPAVEVLGWSKPCTQVQWFVTVCASRLGTCMSNDEESLVPRLLFTSECKECGLGT